MLVSHRNKFIFTKTSKTAGTSIESYYEPFCMPEGDWQESHLRDEYMSEAGIIGHRRPDSAGRKYYNHMPASEIRNLLGRKIWDAYFKFTVVRNPFSKLVSGWYYFHRRSGNVKSTLRSLIRDPVNAFPLVVFGKRDICEFRSWIQRGGQVFDRDKYLINDEVCIDYFIQYEHLNDGIEYVNSELGIVNYGRQLPTFKSGIRLNKNLTREFFDSKTENLVRKMYAWEFARFGYEMPND
jgi:hypothetical protein